MASDTTLERPLPHNLEAERSILGAVLLDNHALNVAVEKLRADDFFLPQHRKIYERMVQLGESHGGRTQITSGLQETEHVVGDGSLFLQFKNSLQH